LLGMFEMVNFVCIVFNFVQGHAGAKGYELADMLARTEVISDGRGIDFANVLHAHREAGRLDDSLRG
jgi:ribonuclease HI